MEVGYGISYMNVNGGVIIGVSKHLGFSPPGLSGNFNIGESHGW